MTMVVGELAVSYGEPRKGMGGDILPPIDANDVTGMGRPGPPTGWRKREGDAAASDSSLPGGSWYN